MTPNKNYLFGNAEVAGMLANGEEIMSSYEAYVRECKKRNIPHNLEQVYTEFMKECNRAIKLDLHKI